MWASPVSYSLNLALNLSSSGLRFICLSIAAHPLFLREWRCSNQLWYAPDTDYINMIGRTVILLVSGRGSEQRGSERERIETRGDSREGIGENRQFPRERGPA